MKYENKKTGAVIDIESKLSGGDWVEVKTSPSPPAEKKAGGKRGTVRNNK